MSTSVSKAGIRALLTKTGFTSGQILLDGESIGRFVTYGKPGSKGRIAMRSVFGSRIYRGKTKIEVEATSSASMLNKVAAEIADAMKNGTWAETASS